MYFQFLGILPKLDKDILDQILAGLEVVEKFMGIDHQLPIKLIEDFLIDSFVPDIGNGGTFVQYVRYMENKPNKTISNHGQFVLTTPRPAIRQVHWNPIKVGPLDQKLVIGHPGTWFDSIEVRNIVNLQQLNKHPKH